MKTFKLLNESTIEDGDAGIEKKEPSKDSHDADVEEKKSITEEDNATERLGMMATEPPPLPCNEK